jgi:hypothetical protein
LYISGIVFEGKKTSSLPLSKLFILKRQHFEQTFIGRKQEKKPRRKHNRFNGMAEEEVMKKSLPDLICPNLDILIVSSSFVPTWTSSL